MKKIPAKYKNPIFTIQTSNVRLSPSTKAGIRALCKLNRFESQDNPAERITLSLVLQWIADSPKASSCYRTDKI